MIKECNRKKKMRLNFGKLLDFQNQTKRKYQKIIHSFLIVLWLSNNHFFREKDIDEKLARMNTDLAAWKTRLDNRKKQAQKEIEKRTKILAEVSILLSR